MDVRRRLFLKLSDPDNAFVPGDLQLGRSRVFRRPNPFAGRDELVRYIDDLIEALQILAQLRLGFIGFVPNDIGVPDYSPSISACDQILRLVEGMKPYLNEDGSLALDTGVIAPVESDRSLFMFWQELPSSRESAEEHLEAGAGILADARRALDDEEGAGIATTRYMLEQKQIFLQLMSIHHRSNRLVPPPLGDMSDWIRLKEDRLELARVAYHRTSADAPSIEIDAERAAKQLQAWSGLKMGQRVSLTTEVLASEGELIGAQIAVLEARLQEALLEGSLERFDDLSREIELQYEAFVNNAAVWGEASVSLSEGDGFEVADARGKFFLTNATASGERARQHRRAARAALQSGSGIADIIALLGKDQITINYNIREATMGSKFEFNAPVNAGAIGDNAVVFQGELRGVERETLVADIARVRSQLGDDIDETSAAGLVEAENAAKTGDQDKLASGLRKVGSSAWDVIVKVGTGVALAAAKAQLGL